MKWSGKQENPPENLTPGECECGHTRSTHKNGKSKCLGHWPPDEETDYWTDCSCQIYIRDDTPETPTSGELEKLYNS